MLAWHGSGTAEVAGRARPAIFAPVFANRQPEIANALGHPWKDLLPGDTDREPRTVGGVLHRSLRLDDAAPGRRGDGVRRRGRRGERVVGDRATGVEDAGTPGL